MMKWLKKFALEIAPPVTATVLGAFVVHQLWPSGDSTPKPTATPPAAQAPAESPKPASLPSAETSTTAAVPTAAPPPATTPVAPKIGKSSRQSSEVAKMPPREEPPVQRGESEASVLDRAEKALASIPPAKSAGPSLPARVAPPPPPPAVVTVQESPAAPVSPPPAASPPVTMAAVPPTEPPPMGPPREIAAPAPTASLVPPPPSLLPPENQQVQTKSNNPLRVSHSDRENLADIPVGDDTAPDQAPAATSADAAPSPPPAKPKNIIENIFAPLQAVLPERMRN